jgi:hypothetical protein
METVADEVASPPLPSFTTTLTSISPDCAAEHVTWSSFPLPQPVQEKLRGSSSGSSADAVNVTVQPVEQLAEWLSVTAGG